MDWRPRSHGEMPRRPLWGSLAVHGGVGVIALLFALNRPPEVAFESYQIVMVEAPSPEQVVDAPPRQTEELVVETPDPQPPEPDPEPVVEETPPPVVEDVQEAEEPEAEEEEPEPEPEPVEPEPDPVPVDDAPAASEPDDDPEELTGAELTIRMEGLQRDYPAYYGNIVSVLQRCFRPRNATSEEATIYFEIRPDGTTAEERLYERSGNSDFDFGALAAVADCAGRNARFGPLPEDYPYQRLPVLFTFRAREDGAPAAPILQ